MKDAFVLSKLNNYYNTTHLINPETDMMFLKLIARIAYIFHKY